MSVREVGPPDAPVIVLIHGLAGSSMAEWYKVAPLLADRFRVVMIDHRSHGLSVHGARSASRSKTKRTTSPRSCESLDLEPVGIAGYSMGGPIAEAVAYRHPHLVKKLALVGAMAYHPTAWKAGRSVGAVITRGWERLTGTGTPEVRAGYLLAVGAVEPSTPAGYGKRPTGGIPMRARQPAWPCFDSTGGPICRASRLRLSS